MKHIKKIEQFIQESIIGKDIIIIGPCLNGGKETSQDIIMNEKSINKSISDIGKDIIVINPGNDKIYL